MDREIDTLEETLTRVLAHYDVGKLRSAERIEYGHVDENWCIETGRARYFLKRRHPRRCQSDSVIRAQHDLIAWLHRRGIPSPVMIPTTSGKTYLVLDARVHELADYIEGDLYDPGDIRQFHAAARLLGAYHDCAKGFAPQALTENEPLYTPLKVRMLIDDVTEAWRLEIGHPAAGVARRLNYMAQKLGARFAEHGDLPRLVIHGDYYGGNLLFRGDRVVGLVDFDKANWQPRIAEVAEALIYFSSPRPGYLRHLVYPGFLNREAFARFLQEYAESANLDDREIRALPDFICCIWFYMSIYRLLQQYPSRPPQAREALQEVLALVEWVHRNRMKIVEIARSSHGAH